jgi:hypothetical protein
MARNRTVPNDAKVVSVSLGGAVRLVLSTIEVGRRQRAERGDTPSQIVADALWHYLDSVEGVPRQDIEKLMITPKIDTPDIRRSKSGLAMFPPSGRRLTAKMVKEAESEIG